MANDDQKRNYVPIEVESLLRWAENGEDDGNKRPSICKVPSILRDLSPESFKPQLVSIGPLHKEDTNVQDIERLKRSYLHDLMNRQTSPPNQPRRKVEECLQKVNASISKIKSSYSATKYSDAELANMMVMDGCFILEFCLKNFHEEPTLLNEIQRYRISIDLMLLENQIPFFVLQDIFNVITKPDFIKFKSKSHSLTSLLHQVLLQGVHPFKISPNYSNFPDDFSVSNDSEISDPKHVLDCLHKIYDFESSEKEKGMDMEFANQYSALELERSGVIFTPHEEKNKAMAIKFVKASSCFLWPRRKPNTLVMPTLIIQDGTEVVLRNLIAYEQFSPEGNYFFTSYSNVMDMLINNGADVGSLVESRVLVNLLRSHTEAAMVIKNICKNIGIDHFYYIDEIKALDEYYKSFWPNNLARLRRISAYFQNTFNFIALLGVIILFVFTVVPGIYTIMSYYK